MLERRTEKGCHKNERHNGKIIRLEPPESERDLLHIRYIYVHLWKWFVERDSKLESKCCYVKAHKALAA